MRLNGKIRPSKHMLDGELLADRQVVAVLSILRQTDLFGSPEGFLMLVVHSSNLRILERRHHPATRTFDNERVRLFQFDVILLVDRQGVPALSIKPISSVVQKDALCLLYIFNL